MANISEVELNGTTYNVKDSGSIPETEKGAANGVASLDSTGKVPSSQLPSYVDDVLEYSAKSSFPATGETGKIYVDTSTNKTYRWSGSAYVEISESLALGETSSTAYRGDRGKAAYDHSQTTSGNPHNVTKSEVGLGNVGNFKAVSTVASQGLSDTEKANARTNIGAGTSSLTLGTSSTQAAPGNHTHNYAGSSSAGGAALSVSTKGGDVQLGTESSSSDDSGDIVFLYGNGTEKMRIWTDNTYTSKSGPNIRMYNASGTQLFSGKIPLSDGTGLPAATTSAAGLMSATDKSKLDGIASGAQVNSITGVKGNSESSYRTGNVNLTAANVGAVPNTSAGVSAAINLLTTGDSAPTDNDYYVSQYAGGGTSTTTYHRRPVSKLWEYIKGKLSSKGSATQPVYFSNGVPVATTYTLGKSVPSDAVFTDTTYSVATTSANGLMSSSDKAIVNKLSSTYTALTPVSANVEVFTGGYVTIGKLCIINAAFKITNSYATSIFKNLPIPAASEIDVWLKPGEDLPVYIDGSGYLRSPVSIAGSSTVYSFNVVYVTT